MFHRIPGDPDRKIDSLFAVIATDPSNGLEGICAVGAGDHNLQAVSSRRENAEKIRDILLTAPTSTKFPIEIVEFVRRG